MTLQVAVVAGTDAALKDLQTSDLVVSLATDEVLPPLTGPAHATATTLGADLLGERGEVHVLGGSPVQAVVGLGVATEVTSEILPRAVALAMGCATDLRRARLVLRVPRLPRSLSLPVAVDALTEGATLAAHARQPRTTVSPKPDAARPPTTCLLVVPASGDLAVLGTIANAATIRAEAVQLARAIGDMPANRLSPLELAGQAVEAARVAGLDAEVVDAAALERLGAGLILAVGQGSDRPPALAVLRYTPPNATKHVAVVGKGIAFDAGGISIKPSHGMELMVHDKAGAAAAAGIAIGAARLGLPIAVTALLACAENLPGGGAYRPGDVLTGLDGHTVEVTDTDAEGRLVLADALTYAVRLTAPRPVDAIVDLATLTGSIVSALGQETTGLFANDESHATRMLAGAEAAGEALWRMPILPGHRAQLKSERADRKQCADRWGDCAIAAAFLEMYVAKRPWLHLDIAGVAYDEGSPEWPPYHPKHGAAGAGVRTVLRYLESLAAS